MQVDEDLRGARYRPGTTAPGRVARAGRHRGRDVTTIGG
jgi:hypothetical protein